MEQERLRKLEALRQKGIDPYGSRFDGVVRHRRGDGELPGRPQGAHRRPDARRPQFRQGGLRGRARSTGKIQVYFRKDHLGEEGFELFGLLDLGDIIGVDGTLAKTRTGEITLFAEKLLHPEQGAAPAAGEMARPAERGDPLPPALRGPVRQPGGDADLPEARAHHRRDPRGTWTRAGSSRSRRR